MNNITTPNYYVWKFNSFSYFVCTTSTILLLYLYSDGRQSDLSNPVLYKLHNTIYGFILYRIFFIIFFILIFSFQ